MNFYVFKILDKISFVELYISKRKKINTWFFLRKQIMANTYVCQMIAFLKLNQLSFIDKYIGIYT